MTDNEKLAIWLGGKRSGFQYDSGYVDRYWVFPSTEGMIRCSDSWNPAKHPEQWAMVLEALREKVEHIDIRLGKGTGPTIIKLYKTFQGVFENKPSTKLVVIGGLGQAICTAALEVIGKDGE